MKVIKKQTNSHDCFICGMKNPYGLHAPFYETEDNKVVSVFSFNELHQSYPERVHGGLISAMLDEIAGRAIWITEPDAWGVTISLTVKYRKPVPYDKQLRAIGYILKNSKITFVGKSEIYDENDVLLAEAEATYFKAPIDKICEHNHDDVNVLIPDNVTDI